MNAFRLPCARALSRVSPSIQVTKKSGQETSTSNYGKSISLHSSFSAFNGFDYFHSTCKGAKWSCKEATESDKLKYPAASDVRSRCRSDYNEEFTTCEPAEPMTCRNMHSYNPSTTVECHAGCVCKKGFVFDTSEKRCVLPTDCSCHHGGQSFKEGGKIKSDCNNCICKAGKWDCTDRPCAATCTTWGDSHFETFDGKDYDFQGACTYVLSKGAIDGNEGYSITIQNVLCGSLGVTCSKSVTVSLVGKYPESVTLSSVSSIPGSYSEKSGKFHLIAIWMGL